MNAESYARQAHASDRYGDEPYSVHLEAVVAIVRGADDSDEAASVAWLHDVLEDTEATAADLSLAFGAVVSIAVALVTDPEGENRRTRKARLHERLICLHPAASAPARLALLVKAADRLANVRASAADSPGKLKMYRKEHAAFREAVHRPGLCDEIWAELDRALT